MKHIKEFNQFITEAVKFKSTTDIKDVYDYLADDAGMDINSPAYVFQITTKPTHLQNRKKKGLGTWHWGVYYNEAGQGFVHGNPDKDTGEIFEYFKTNAKKKAMDVAKKLSATGWYK